MQLHVSRAPVLTLWAAVVARRLTALGCVGALAVGCTGPAIPAAGNQFDGTYQGDNRVVRGFGWVCAPPSYQDAVTVTAGRFNYTFFDQLAQPALIPVQIAADGTFRGRIQYLTDSGNQKSVARADRLGNRERPDQRDGA